MIAPPMMTLELAAAAHDPAGPPAAPTAADDRPSGVLRFEIRDGRGDPVAGRLTFIGPGGPGADLFPNADAAPHDLAVRSNVIYTLSGGGAVRVPVGDYSVYASRGLVWSVDRRDLTVEAEGGRAVIEIRDRGPGFTAEALERAHDLFYTTTESGLGLGIPFARKIIESFGGDIDLANLPEGGAKVSLSLPID